jgi:hypothetical protein
MMSYRLQTVPGTWLPDVNGDSSRDWRDLAIEKEFVYRVEDINGME